MERPFNGTPSHRAEFPAGARSSPVQLSGRDIARCSSCEARALIPFVESSAMQVLPLSLLKAGGKITLHCASSDDSALLRERVRLVSGMEASFTAVPQEALEEAIVSAYLGSDETLAATMASFGGQVAQKEAPRAAPAYGEPASDAAKFLAALLEYGVARGASDLHLCPVHEGAVVKIRIDGELLSQEQQPYSPAFHEQVVARLKALAGLDLAQRRLPQDGAFSFCVAGKERAARLSTLPAVYGESAVVRFLGAVSSPNVSLLGLEPATLKALRGAMRRTQGAILFTGPTGSGKTTTMYAVAQELKGAGRNVVTVEDPVESMLRGIVQVRVNEAQDLSYPRAIRSVLRHDPDVILIGEMRDPESAKIGLESASTGHLTLSSLHVGSALLALERLAALGVPAERSVQAVALVVTQRLLQRLCEQCKAVDDHESARFGCTVFRPQGCPSCSQAGFIGRVLVTEALDLRDVRAKAACVEHRTAHGLLEALPKGALIPWTASLQELMLQGAISAAQFSAFIDAEMAFG
jgi:type II secretory ATPase GspE/PulE/Tfp pilus assembly ATPase PilB-like protein